MAKQFKITYVTTVETIVDAGDDTASTEDAERYALKKCEEMLEATGKEYTIHSIEEVCDE